MSERSPQPHNVAKLEVLLVGALLGGSVWLSAWSFALGVVAALRLTAATSATQSGALLLVIILGLATAYVSLRISIDRTLFSSLDSTDPDALGQLDAALSQLGWVKPPGRDLSSRLRATTKLVKALGSLLVVQTIAAIFGLMPI